MILSKLWGRFRRKQAIEWVPIMDCQGFINTEEGWRLYGECTQTGDIEPYYQAKLEYLGRQRQNERENQTIL